MCIVDKLFSMAQYSLEYKSKKQILLDGVNELSELHYNNCDEYKNIIDTIYKKKYIANEYEELPYFPVRLFKTLDLKSIPNDKIQRILTSSGTSSQQVSRITLDRDTAMLQTKTLASIVTSFIGPKRLPMLIIDSEQTIRNKSSLSARGAGLVGLSNFGREHTYLLDDNMQLNDKIFLEFVEKFRNDKILIFGFTFMIWQNFLQELINKKIKVDLSNAVIIHSGGWKKLETMAVSNEVFKKTLLQYCGITKVHNFYGMVEQVGSIYMECEHGYFHAPNFSEIIIRDTNTWNPQKIGNKGVLQTISIIPKSYPGHSLLTEDLAIIHGIDDCPCGRKGSYFSVCGRIPRAELRGCSDTFAASL